MADIDLTEAVEAVMRDAYETRRRSVPDHHPYKGVTWEATTNEVRESYRASAERHVAAALPAIREQLARQIQARRAEVKAVEASSRLPLRSDTMTALIRGLDIAADVVRGGS